MHRRRLGHGPRNHAPNQGSCPPTERHKQCGCARSHNQEHQQFKAAIAAIGAHLQPILPLLKNEWVGSGESVLWARSRAGEARRSEPLTAITGPDNRALLNAGMVRHSATEARAR